MTTLWRFSDPVDHRFAAAGRRGSWTKSEGVCPECGDSRQLRVQPLIMVWEPGSDLVGDFVWPLNTVVVTDQVLQVLQEHFSGFEAGPVEMIEDTGKRPKRGKPQVRLPYEGPPLHELWVTASVHLDRERSNVEFERQCGTCGREFWNVFGVERWDSHFDRDCGHLVRTKTERLPNQGIFVSDADLQGADIFRVAELPAWVFCTDAVRQLIEKEGFSNCSFLEMGDTY